MGLQLLRQKKRNFKLSIAYKLSRFLPFGHKAKIRLYLDLSWIFARLAHEQIVQYRFQINQLDEEDILTSYIHKDATILDLGCGEGYVISRLLSKTENILGVDFNIRSIEIAQEKFKNTKVKFICDDVFSYLKNAENKKFDYIILSHILEHIDDPYAFLKALAEYSDSFYIEVPDFEASHLNLYRLKVNTDLVYTDIDHVSEFDRREIQKLVSHANLKIVQSEFKFGVMKFWCEKEK